MNEHPGTTSVEMEFSKLWMKDNPVLFANAMSDFLSEHNANLWELAARQTNGFFTLEAKLKVPSLTPSA